MTSDVISGAPLTVKRAAAYLQKAHRKRMGRPREKKPQAPKSKAQAMFIRRVREELGETSVTALSKRDGAPAQRTINDVLNGADPKLATVQQIADALNIPVWQLFLEKADVVRLLTPRDDNVRKLPEPPRMLQKPSFSGRDKGRKTG